MRSMPYSNEVGLRMLIGGAAREAAVLGYHVTPLFSYYAYHGPVFRVLLRLNRGKLHDNRCYITASVLHLFYFYFLVQSLIYHSICCCRHYGFIGFCHKCGNSKEFSWDELGQISCSCSDSRVRPGLFEASSL